MTYFQDTDFEADRMEKVFEILELKKVDVRMNDVPDEVKYLFLVLMKRLSMPREWKKEMRKPRKDLQKLT